MRKVIGFLMGLIVSPAWSQTLCLDRSDGVALPPPYVVIEDYGAIPVVDLRVNFDELRARRSEERGSTLPRPNSWRIAIPAHDQAVAVFTELPVDEGGHIHLTVPCLPTNRDRRPVGHLKPFRVMDHRGMPIPSADIFVIGTSAHDQTSTKGEMIGDRGFPMDADGSDVLILKQGYNPTLLNADFFDPWEPKSGKEIVELVPAPYATVAVHPEFPTGLSEQQTMELWAGFVPTWSHLYFLFLIDPSTHRGWEGSVDLSREFFRKRVSEAIAAPISVVLRPSPPQALPKFVAPSRGVPMVALRLEGTNAVLHEPAKPVPPSDRPPLGVGLLGLWGVGALALGVSGWGGTRWMRRWLRHRRLPGLTVPS